MKLISQLSANFLILVWTYTGLDKLLQFEESRKAFHNQTFSPELAELLAYSVPITEILIAVLLLFHLTRWWGFLSSILLLSVFTTYVGLIWTGAFPRVPCNCAGILESLGWKGHFILNLGLIGMATIGLRTTKKINRLKKRKTLEVIDNPKGLSNQR